MRVLWSTYGSRGDVEPMAALGVRPSALAPETGARATAVVASIRTDGAAVAAKLLVDAINRERPPVSA